MKLLRVIRSTNPASGGPIEGLLRTSEALLGLGHQVEILSLDDPAHAYLTTLRVPTYALGEGTKKYAYQPRLGPWLKENAHRYDAVIVHGLWNYVSVGCWRVLRSMDLPYLIFPHGMLDPWFAKASVPKHIAKQALWYLAEGRVLRDAKAVLFTSEEEMRRAGSCFSGFRYHGQVVRYGAAGPTGASDVQRGAFFHAFPELRGRRILLYLGRIHPKKGIDLLLRAFAAEIHGGRSRLDLVIAGPDEANTLRHLQKLSQSLALEDCVHWIGMLRDELKWGALLAADVFILPSHQENFAIAVAEAMASSAPVLISDKVNIWREVVHSGAGLVQPDTVEGVKKLIRSFLELTPVDQTRMRKAARDGYEKNFTIDTAARDLVRIVNEAVAATTVR